MGLEKTVQSVVEKQGNIIKKGTKYVASDTTGDGAYVKAAIYEAIAGPGTQSTLLAGSTVSILGAMRELCKETPDKALALSLVNSDVVKYAELKFAVMQQVMATDKTILKQHFHAGTLTTFVAEIESDIIQAMTSVA